MSRIIHVLDHGWVKLVEHMGDDMSAVRSARQSYDGSTGDDPDKDIRLLNSLVKRGHTSPFEAQVFTFQVQAPIFVFRQWHRHRTQSFNELSARYTEMQAQFYTPDASLIGTQDDYEKQARNIDTSITYDPAKNQREQEIAHYRHACHNAFVYYEHLLKQGWPRELARAVLPFATYSRMSATMNMLNFVRFARLRLDSHAQYEIRVYAEAMVKLLRDVYPHTVSAWETYHWDTVAK